MRESTEDRVSVDEGLNQDPTLLDDSRLRTCHTVRIGSRLVLLGEVDVARNVPQNKQMADEK